MQTLLPEGWPRPKGYSNGIAVNAGRMVFVAGVVGWDKDEQFRSENLVDQFRQTLMNTKAIMAEGGAGPEHMVRMTWYITDKKDYLANLRDIGAAYRDVMGKNYPAMACVEVSALMEDAAKIEIETTCVIEP
ncbi:enamine deaminase RidA [Kordiimonas sediminis]|uniref:Enamine deaminase RidA n=1 Tax=Kordiimonas sediminis TaxID=1735581 RepID=A0A919AMV4_9PROT|nr:RidA family protein [Kordiimonas sediminis]GHF13542.1 enamine deaminase RidA [Kordiimonas sediminis]